MFDGVGCGGGVPYEGSSSFLYMLSDSLDESAACLCIYLEVWLVSTDWCGTDGGEAKAKGAAYGKSAVKCL